MTVALPTNAAHASGLTNRYRPVDLPPMEVRALVERGATLVDVREPFEHAGEHIAGAELVPLSRFDGDDVRRQFGDDVIFHCRAGSRSLTAAQRYARPGEAIRHLDGGIERWKEDGLPVLRPKGGPKLDVMRQVQVTVGTLMLLGVILGASVHPAFLAVSGFVGAGLVFAGTTGWCGMAKLLAVMPWNRR